MGLIFNGNGDVIKAVDGSLTVEGLDFGGISNVNAGIGTFSGNLNVGGVLTYEDVKNVDSVGIVTARDHINIVTDSKKLQLGAGQDLTLHHDGSNSVIQNITGNLYLNPNNSQSGITLIGSTGAVTLFHGGNLKFETESTGAKVTGDLNVTGNIDVADNVRIKLGTGDDMSIWHDGTTTKFSDSGPVLFYSTSFTVHSPSAENIIIGTQNSSVDLYYDNSKKLETTSSGVTVTGTLTATTLTGALSTTDACQTGDLTILNGNPDLRLKDSNHGGNNTEHMIAFQDSSGNNQMNIGSPFGEQHLRIKHGTNELVKIQTDGKFLVGHTAAYGSSKAQIFNTAQYVLDLSTWSADANGPTVDFYKSRNATVGSATVVQSGDVVGRLRFLGNDGANSRTAAQITAEVDGTPGTNDMPGRLIFSTVPDDSTTVTERLRISADGAIKFTGTNYNMTWRYAASALRLDDNAQLNFGTDDDGDIYHDGSQMIVNNTTGTLKVRSNNLQLTRTDNEVHINCASGAQVDLYYSGNKKLETTSAGITVTGTISDSTGNVRKSYKNEQANAYTLVAGDAGKVIGAQNTITIPASVFGDGDMVTIVNYTAGNITLTQGSGLTLYNSGDASTGNKTLATRGMATVWFPAGTTAYMSGTGIS